MVMENQVEYNNLAKINMIMFRARALSNEPTINSMTDAVRVDLRPIIRKFDVGSSLKTAAG